MSPGASTQGERSWALCVLRVTPRRPDYDSNPQHAENGKEHKERREPIPRSTPIHRLGGHPNKNRDCSEPNHNVQSQGQSAGEWSYQRRTRTNG